MSVWLTCSSDSRPRILCPWHSGPPPPAWQQQEMRKDKKNVRKKPVNNCRGSGHVCFPFSNSKSWVTQPPGWVLLWLTWPMFYNFQLIKLVWYCSMGCWIVQDTGSYWHRQVLYLYLIPPGDIHIHPIMVVQISKKFSDPCETFFFCLSFCVLMMVQYSEPGGCIRDILLKMQRYKDTTCHPWSL